MIHAVRNGVTYWVLYIDHLSVFVPIGVSAPTSLLTNENKVTEEQAKGTCFNTNSVAGTFQSRYCTEYNGELYLNGHAPVQMISVETSTPVRPMMGRIPAHFSEAGMK